MKNFKHCSVEDYFMIFWRRGWYFLVTFLLVTAGVSFYAWRLPPVYKSEATILVESQLISEDYVRSTVQATIEDRINLVQQQVYSRTFLEGIIKEFQLNRSEDKELSMEESTKRVRSAIEIDVHSSNAFSIAYYASEPLFARAVAQRLAEALIQSNTSSRQVKAIEADRFIDEQLRQCQRDLGAHEEKMKAFKIAHQGELTEEGVGTMTALEELRSQLAASENALQDALNRRTGLEFRLKEQKRFRLLLRNLPSSELLTKSQVKGTKDITEIEEQLISKRASLKEMSVKYTGRHPDVAELIREIQDLERRLAQDQMKDKAKDLADAPSSTVSGDGERNNNGERARPALQNSVADDAPVLDLEDVETKAEMEGLDREIARRNREKDEIAKQIRSYQGQLRLAPKVEKELLALSREHEALLQHCSYVRGIKFNAQMTASLETNKKNVTFKITDAANLPEKPALPDRQRITLIGLVAGIFLGLGMVFLREFLDPTLRDENEAAAELNLPILISLPEISMEQAPLKKQLRNGHARPDKSGNLQS